MSDAVTWWMVVLGLGGFVTALVGAGFAGIGVVDFAVRSRMRDVIASAAGIDDPRLVDPSDPSEYRSNGRRRMRIGGVLLAVGFGMIFLNAVIYNW